MNADHAKALREYCRHYKQRDPAAVNMVGIDCDGIRRARRTVNSCDLILTSRWWDANTARADVGRYGRTGRVP